MLQYIRTYVHYLRRHTYTCTGLTYTLARTSKSSHCFSRWLRQNSKISSPQSPSILTHQQNVNMTSSIPSVDLSPFFVDEGVVIGDTPTPMQTECAKVIDAACREHGFLHATGFGLSKELSSKLFFASKDLFDLDDTRKKESLFPWHGSHNAGYIPMCTESHNPSRPPDMKEAFNVQCAGKNDFRGAPTDFESATLELMSVFKNATTRYAIACALALGLPIDNFEMTLRQFDLCTIKLLHYPPCRLEDTGIGTDKPIRIGEHIDFGAFTFLLLGENGAEGLQIKPVAMGQIGGEAGGEHEGWAGVNVPSDGDGAIINTGALMARWTNDEWRATAHRVIVQSAKAASRDRYSVACFVDPDSTAIISVHDKFVTPDKPRLYEPISGKAFLQMKLNEVEKRND